MIVPDVCKRLPWCAAVLALSLSACSSQLVARPAGGVPDIPTDADYKGVFVKAFYYINHQDVFGTNLLEKGIVPVFLRMAMRGGDDNSELAKIDVRDMNARLYLPDGSELLATSYEDILRGTALSGPSARRP